MDLEIRAFGPAEPDLAEGFLQSTFWGDFKASFGWRPRRFGLRLRGEGGAWGPDGQLLVLERGLAPGLSFAYVPHGPELEVPPELRSQFLADLVRALRPALSPLCLFLRFDPPWHEIERRVPVEGEGGDAVGTAGVPESKAAWTRPFLSPPFRRAAVDIQPPDTVLLDLRASEEVLLERMKPKWRYNIRLAAKKGVAVAEGGAGELPIFYSLYRETAERDRIALHPESYYERLFALAAGAAQSPRADLRLWVARHQGQALAAIVTLFRGERATYLYGASGSAKRSLMPAYALQWEAIKAAKAAGCAVYDFYGIPPSDDTAHPMAGLYRFKTGFGGDVAHRAGSWDYPLRPGAWAAFRAVEAARSWYFKDFRKRGKRGGGE